MIRVVGLGQRAAGDDAVGLLVVDALVDRVPPCVTLHPVGDPAELVELCDGKARVIVVDAVVDGSPPGTVRRVEVRELAPAGRGLSTHGLSVPQALELAGVLHGPTEIAVVGVSIALPTGPALVPSAAVRAAVPVAAALVLEALQCH